MNDYIRHFAPPRNFFSKSLSFPTAQYTAHLYKTLTVYCRFYMFPVTHSRFQSIYYISEALYVIFSS